MEKKFDELNLHQKMEIIIREMVEKEVPFKDAQKEFEKIYIEMTSKKYKGNKTKMAKALGIHRNTLHHKTKFLKIREK